MNRLTVGLLAIFVVLLLGTGILAFILRDRANTADPSVATSTPGATPHPENGKSGNNTFLGELFGPDSSGLGPSSYANWEAAASRIALRFSLAAFLAALLAFRPRRGVSYSRRNPYVAQTQILMAVVAGAMMMVVGDSAARAFGIFAAASLVRFRTNIRDPKETTVLLICLGVGLAAGIGRWDMAVILTVFVLLALAILEYFESSQAFRSMEVSIATRNVDLTNAALQQVFLGHRVDNELLELDRQDEEDPMGKIVYQVNLGSSVTTSALSEEIFKADTANVDSIEWDQKEITTYSYR